MHQHGREDGELVDEEEIRLVHRRFGRVLTQYQHRAGVADASLDQAVQLVRVVLQVTITHEASGEVSGAPAYITRGSRRVTRTT